MRIGVTGGSGFVGGAVCRALRAAGAEVVAFDRRAPADPAHAGGPVRIWDLAAGPLAEPPELDAVVHCAAFVADTGALETARLVNVQGTLNAARTFPGARFVHVSSCSVYDPRTPQVNATEAEAPAPEQVRWSNAYGLTKAEAERALRELRPDAVVLRPHAVYGPGDTTLLPRLREAGRRGTVPLPGSGRQLHSVTAIANLTAAVCRAVEPGVPPGVYNVTDPEPVLLALAIAALATSPGGRPPRVRPLPERPLVGVAVGLEGLQQRTGRPRRLPFSRYTVEHLARERTFDISAARTALGYSPEHSSFAGCEHW